MDVKLNGRPGLQDVLIEQIRVVGLRLRPVGLVTAIVIAGVTVLAIAEILRGEGRSWFDSSQWFPFAVVSFGFAFAVWRRDGRPGGFLWTLPVERRALALARVFAGWVWLISGLLAISLWQLALGAAAGAVRGATVPLDAFVAATTMYLIGCAVLIGLRHPFLWLAGVFALLYLLGFLEAEGNYVETLPGSAYALVLAFAAAVLWLAVSRHQEK